MTDNDLLVANATKIFKSESFLRLMNGDIPKKDWSKGGFLCIARSLPGGEFERLSITALGKAVDDPHYVQYRHTALENALLLHQHLDLCTSWEHGNGVERRLGGAVRMGGTIISFSGFLEIPNESFVLIVAQKSDFEWSNQVDELIKKSGSDDIRKKFWMDQLP